MNVTIYVTVPSSVGVELVSFFFAELAPPYLELQTPDRFEWIHLVFPHNQAEFRVAVYICSASISPIIFNALIYDDNAVDDDNVCTAPIMTVKDILEFVQNIDADFDDENEVNNAFCIPTSSEMRNIMKTVSTSATFVFIMNALPDGFMSATDPVSRNHCTKSVTIDALGAASLGCFR
ncbi:hypothetical protein TNCV_4994221 [Trichonephila clavipes]|nr:hypothetical protein TNCV_4994221 [Trichonephila clavipes]